MHNKKTHLLIDYGFKYFAKSIMAKDKGVT